MDVGLSSQPVMTCVRDGVAADGLTTSGIGVVVVVVVVVVQGGEATAVRLTLDPVDSWWLAIPVPSATERPGAVVVGVLLVERCCVRGADGVSGRWLVVDLGPARCCGPGLWDCEASRRPTSASEQVSMIHRLCREG